MTDKKISEKEVLHIAMLARLRLTRKEVKKYQKQLADIINFFDTLKEVNTSDVSETSQVGNLENKLRKDEVKNFLKREHALQNAPDEKDGYFRTISPFK